MFSLRQLAQLRLADATVDRNEQVSNTKISYMSFGSQTSTIGAPSIGSKWRNSANGVGINEKVEDTEEKQELLKRFNVVKSVSIGERNMSLDHAFVLLNGISVEKNKNIKVASRLDSRETPDECCWEWSRALSSHQELSERADCT
ncbi:hypothetical protein M8C21_011923 [Ambrosia artemisiifolia]|uniref:Uncharacterized protein n=1 Tax=Ambrosia artemisiifolia TaxID=4212 RepID=A0AAD5BSD6_AMBAR|nr:hypothetical protein M8C21_011923 [Ambrosia artemisiifolia]